jgi:hypothetical protein
LADKHGVGLIIDDRAFRNYPLRSFLLDRLRVPEAAEWASRRSADLPPRAESFSVMRWRNRADRVLIRFGLRRLPQPTASYSEPHFQFDPDFFKLDKTVSIFGYFQSERYFTGIADELRRYFQPCEPLGPKAQAMAGLIARTETPVSVHIRRGDYVKSVETARVHGALDARYYKKALRVLQSMLASPITVFVFSDDPADAEAVLDFVPRDKIVHVRGDPDKPWEDMSLMAQCRHHIIANSSFSWWGAWLNPSEDKIVIAPREWFTAAELRQHNISDLFPPEWILV